MAFTPFDLRQHRELTSSITATVVLINAARLNTRLPEFGESRHTGLYFELRESVPCREIDLTHLVRKLALILVSNCA